MRWDGRTATSRAAGSPGPPTTWPSVIAASPPVCSTGALAGVVSSGSAIAPACSVPAAAVSTASATVAPLLSSAVGWSTSWLAPGCTVGSSSVWLSIACRFLANCANLVGDAGDDTLPHRGRSPEQRGVGVDGATDLLTLLGQLELGGGVRGALPARLLRLGAQRRPVGVLVALDDLDARRRRSSTSGRA